MQAEVAVVGSGVVGSATALELARRGAAVALLEAEPEPGLAASGTNSGILHTGFDSVPGELETELILRSAALRDPVLEALRVPVLRCGALMRPADGSQRDAVAALAANAERNGVEVSLARRRRARGAGRVGHRSGRLHAGARAAQPNATVRSFAPASESRGSSESGGEFIVSEPGGESRRRRARRQLRRARGRRGGAARRRRLVRGLPAQGRVPRLRSAGRRSGSSGSCCRCRRSAPRASWSSRRSTARSWRARRPSTRRTRTTGRCAPRPGMRSCRRRAPCTRLSRRRAGRRLRRPAARRPRRQLRDRPVGRLPGPRQRGGDPLHGADRLARDRRAGVRDRRRARACALGPERSLEPGPTDGLAGPWWRRTAEYRAHSSAREAG